MAIGIGSCVGCGIRGVISSPGEHSGALPIVSLLDLSVVSSIISHIPADEINAYSDAVSPRSFCSRLHVETAQIALE